MTRAEWWRGAALISAPAILDVRTPSRFPVACPPGSPLPQGRPNVSSGDAPWTCLKSYRPPRRHCVAVAADDRGRRAARLIVEKLTYATGRDPADRQRPRLVRRGGAGAARPDRRSLAVEHARATTPAAPQAGLLSVAGIPSRPPAAGLAEQRRPDRADAACARPSSAWTSSACAPWSRIRRWATAGSGGWPPASWRAWRASAFPPTASAFATIMGCSSR